MKKYGKLLGFLFMLLFAFSLLLYFKIFLALISIDFCIVFVRETRIFLILISEQK